VKDWELKAREQIRDLVARYNAYGDGGRFDQLIALFTDDAAMEVVGYRKYQGKGEIQELFRGAAQPQKATSGTSPAAATPPKASSGTSSISPISPIWHHTSTLVIDLEDESAAQGRCYFSVLTTTGLDHWGRYRDEYRAENGQWLFQRRRVQIDGKIAGGWAEKNLASPAAR